MPQTPGISTLWLPLASRGIAWGAVLLTAILYGATMARGIGFYDSGELALTSVQLGLGHPPGQPVYTLLGWLFSHLPGVAPLLGLNLLSVSCGALTVLPVLSIAHQMLPEADRQDRGVSACIAATVVIVAQHAALWEQSTRIEVYALAALLALWSVARLAHVLEHPCSSDGWVALGAVLGACAAVNPVMALFTGLSGIPAVVTSLRRRDMSLTNVGWLSAGMLLGLVPYVYVPLIAERTDRLIWGAPTRGQALVDYLTVRDFRVNIGVPLALWARQTLSWLDFSSDSGLLPLWIVGLTGHVVAPPRRLTRWCAPLLAALSMLYLSRYAVFRPELPDCVSYASIATWLCGAGCAALTGLLWLRRSRVAALALGLAVTTAAAVAPPLVFGRTRSIGDPARTLTQGLLDSLPPRALLVVGADHWVAPLWYLQEVEHKRPDVVVLATGLLSSSWYFDHLYRRHPDLVKTALLGPGGRWGRLARLLHAQLERPIAFADEREARGLGFQTCAGPVFAHARIACSALPAERNRFTERVAELTRGIDAGEPTVAGVLADVSLARARLLAAHGFLPDALRSLFAGINPVMAKLDSRLVERVAALPPSALQIPTWKHEAALGDPAQNLFVAAQLAGRAGDAQHAVVWLMLARELGLAEAEQALADMARSSRR